jgi:hypothetical protein
MHQAKGTGDAEDEDSFAAALFTSFDLGNGVSFAPLAEYVYQDNPGGAANDDRHFLTLAGQFDWKGYNLALAWTMRDTNSASSTDYQFQASIGYAFAFGLEVNAGWKIANESNIETRTLGIKAAYGISF